MTNDMRLQVLAWLVLVLVGAEDVGHAAETGWAEIRVVDSVSGRGILLTELETVNNIRFVTDNAGRVAFQEPGLMGKQVFFSVRCPGYETPKDGCGAAGVRLVLPIGNPVEVKLRRTNFAERLGRLTGEGRYRDSVLLGYQPPAFQPVAAGDLAGQDSIQAVRFRDKVYCFWGRFQPNELPARVVSDSGGHA